MGSWHVFSCDKCDYTVTVSGGLDRGFYAVTETMQCDDCIALVDVLVGLAKKMSGRVEITTGEKFGKCPKCEGRNVRAWSEKDRPCPRCEGKMVMTKENVVFWD